MGRNNLQYGGVSKSNVIFEWVSESTACDACKSLDGNRYKDIDDVPEKPHPNCKCFVKDIYLGEEDYEALQQEIDKIYGDLSSLRDQISTSMNEDESDIQNPEIQDILDDVYAFEYDLDEVTEDMEQATEDEDSTERFQSLKAKIDEMKSAFQELKQKIIDKINSLKKEICDCWVIFDNFEKALDDAQKTQSEAENVLDLLNDFLSEKLIEPAREVIEDLVSGLEQAIGTFGDFVSNWEKMKEINKDNYHEGTPEYYHSKANCEATQRGEIGEATSEILGQTREFFDYYKDIYLKGKSAQQASYNNDYDFAQNKAGRILGKEHSDQSCEDILKYRRPKDLPKDSW